MQFEIEQLYNSLFSGDCFNIIPSFPSHFVDLILADMPYNQTECKFESEINLVKLWDLYHQLITKDGIIALFSQEPFTSRLIASNYDEFQFKWIWKKNRSPNFMQCLKRPMNNYEEICVFYTTTNPVYNPQMKKRSIKGLKRVTSGTESEATGHHPIRRKASESCLTISKNTTKPLYAQNFSNLDRELKYPELVIEGINPIASTSNEKVLHPTQKPEEIYEYLIKTHSNPKAVVMDNFSGSCTNALSCLKTQRKFICIEKNLNNKGEKLGYIKISLDRIKKAYPNMRIEKEDYDINGYQFKQYHFHEYFDLTPKKE